MEAETGYPTYVPPVFPHFRRQMPQLHIKLDKDNFLTHSLQFTIISEFVAINVGSLDSKNIPYPAQLCSDYQGTLDAISP